MIPVENAHLLIAASTHPGLRGKLNEDRYLVSSFQLGTDDHTPSVLALLADGIGGHHAGEIAAELAIESIHKFIAASPTTSPVRVLKQALTHASQVILSHSQANPSLMGMGTTLVCAWVIGNRLYAASVGDSRLYLQRDQKIIRLTTDHTWIQEALTHGTLTPEQARGHPNAHIIRRFLGSSTELNPDLRLRLFPGENDDKAEANQGLYLLPGDRLLLCSDGLTDLVMDDEILELSCTIPIDARPARLIELANQRGGHDNTTVVALEVPQAAGITRPIFTQPPSIPLEKPQPQPVSWVMIILLLVAILMMLSLLVYRLFM